jgi:DNA replication protein DnaC
MLSVQETAELNRLLKDLHLPTIRSTFEEFAIQAQKNSTSYEEYLLELLQAETQTRKINRVERLLRESKIPLEKSLESFQQERIPHKEWMKVQALLKGEFVRRCENVLSFGNPGTGKTHLLCAIGQELIREGYRVRFYSCNLLVQELLRAKKELRMERLFKKLSRLDVLIVDDIGYVQQSREEMEVLFTLLAQRYERGSLMITSNLPFSQWDQIFKDPMTTAAAIDRVIHHSVIIELNLKSYRMEEAQKQQKKEKQSDGKMAVSDGDSQQVSAGHSSPDGQFEETLCDG